MNKDPLLLQLSVEAPYEGHQNNLRTYVYDKITYCSKKGEIVLFPITSLFLIGHFDAQLRLGQA